MATSEMNAVLLFQNSNGVEVARKAPASANPMDFTGVAYASYYFEVEFGG